MYIQPYPPALHQLYPSSIHDTPGLDRNGDSSQTAAHGGDAFPPIDPPTYSDVLHLKLVESLHAVLGANPPSQQNDSTATSDAELARRMYAEELQ
jgi:hypothetical protein